VMATANVLLVPPALVARTSCTVRAYTDDACPEMEPVDVEKKRPDGRAGSMAYEVGVPPLLPTVGWFSSILLLRVYAVLAPDEYPTITGGNTTHLASSALAEPGTSLWVLEQDDVEWGVHASASVEALYFPEPHAVQEASSARAVPVVKPSPGGHEFFEWATQSPSLFDILNVPATQGVQRVSVVELPAVNPSPGWHDEYVCALHDVVPPVGLKNPSAQAMQAVSILELPSTKVKPCEQDDCE